MRPLLRQAAVVLAALAATCFWSCERHHPDELPAEGQHGIDEADQHHREPGDAQIRATTAMSVTPAARHPSPTPAEFFPQTTPR